MLIFIEEKNNCCLNENLWKLHQTKWYCLVITRKLLLAFQSTGLEGVEGIEGVAEEE